MSEQAEAADHLSRRRVRKLSAVAAVFAIQQTVVNMDPPTRPVHFVALCAWLLVAVVLLLVIRTGGMPFSPAALRRLADDDVTRANRAGAFEWGFTAAMGAAIALTLVAAFVATPVLVALRLVILAGLFTAIFRFVQLERRALG